ncbi:SDR family oxidoreductase [Helicobacter sp. 11S02596-1]|uniref:SDR family NAD(P)-dependent oxidoreductase n=1 Tax=Helicobacter sp. 11S02596-1 TaxID=1476194 RepID=UPI000BA5AA5B|nr:SDR family oxidoreductase [Helicobacter sp. 11S02596-1]PAF45172.1 hypothetical protein BJI48_00985 [Helicobacter sp. 11S02596-1]
MNYTLLSGGTSDIGKAIAHTLGKDHTLLLSARDEKKLEKILLSLPRDLPHQALPLDLNDIASIKPALEAFVLSKEAKNVEWGGGRQTRGIETFIHCAGYVGFGAMKHFDYANALVSFNVNLLSCCEIIATLLKKSNQNALKNIILISSISSLRGYKGSSIYAAAKAGLDALARSLCDELTPNVKINSILLGPIPTKANAYLDQSPLNTPHIAQGSCEDVAGLVAFLCSKASSHINGQNIVLDGGRSVMGR